MVILKSMGKKFTLLVALAFACAGLMCIASVSMAQADEYDGKLLYRIYNPNSGEHFYTTSAEERNNLCGGKRAGWSYEGVLVVTPESGVPVFRLYNPNAGDHHYTSSEEERDFLVSVGWNFEGTGFMADPDQAVPLYRQYNPNAIAGAHNYTSSTEERDGLVSLGWRDEQIGWYASSNPGHITYDDSIYVTSYVDVLIAENDDDWEVADPVPLNTLVKGMTGPMDPEIMRDFLVPSADVAPATNVASTMFFGEPPSDYESIAYGISNQSVSFWVETRNNSGVISIELDSNGLVQPDAMANCYSFK